MNEQLKHIFDSSACLSKRQLKDYAAGTMNREEAHALEHHLNTCFFCSEALDGMMAHEDALVTAENLNSNFLKDHFSLTNPQVHLNSMAPAVSAPPIQKQVRAKGKVQPLLRPSGIAAALILGFGILWYLEFGKNDFRPRQVAQQTPAEAAKARVADNITQEPVAAISRESAASSFGDENKASVARAGETGEDSGPLNEQPQKPQALIATNPRTGAAQEPANDTKQQEPEEVVVKAYKVPVIRRDDPAPAATLTAEQIEKLPSRKTGDDVVSPSAAIVPSKKNNVNIGAARSNSAAYLADEIRAGESVKEEARERSAKADEGVLASANELFSSGKYSAALAAYKKQMHSGSDRDRQQAALQAARCYVQLGHKEKAVALLESLAENGSGAQKRQARRLLKDLGGDKAEE